MWKTRLQYVLSYYPYVTSIRLVYFMVTYVRGNKSLFCVWIREKRTYDPDLEQCGKFYLPVNRKALIIFHITFYSIFQGNYVFFAGNYKKSHAIVRSFGRLGEMWCTIAIGHWFLRDRCLGLFYTWTKAGWSAHRACCCSLAYMRIFYNFFHSNRKYFKKLRGIIVNIFIK